MEQMGMLAAESDVLLTRREAAKYLNIAAKTLANWSCSGRHGLELIRIGKRLVRYKRSELDSLITAHQTKAEQK